MRTTITLDDEIAETLQSLARQRRQPFKRVVNETLRDGLRSQTGKPTPFVQTTSPLGARPGVDLEHALRLASSLEVEKIARKLQQQC